MNSPVIFNDPSGHTWKPPTGPITIADISTWSKVAQFFTGLAVGIVGLVVDNGKIRTMNAYEGMTAFATTPIAIEFPSGPLELQYRASELHELLDPFAQGHRVTAVLSAETKDGAVVKIVASSEHRLSKAQRLALIDDEIEAIGFGHAEVTAIDFAEQNNLRPIAIAASSAICKACSERISSSGVARITRLRSE